MTASTTAGVPSLVSDSRFSESLEPVYVVVPAFNESRVLGDVIRTVRAKYPNVIVVDDGSSDNTADVAREAGAQVICHLVNRGQGAALKTGIEWALEQGAAAVVTFDSDGQHDPCDISLLLRQLGSGYDVVLGSRFLGQTSGLTLGRWVILKLGILFTWVMSGIRLTDTHNGLRAMTRHAASSIRIRQGRDHCRCRLAASRGERRLSAYEVPQP